MNTRAPLESAASKAVLSVSFNKDASCFAVGLETGICIFHAKSGLLKASEDFNGGIGIVQMMGKTNYLAFVGGGRNPEFPQNKTIVWDAQKARVALEIATLTAVRGVQLTPERIVVVLQNSVRVYSFARPPNLLAVYETADNHMGLSAMSDRSLAFPGRKPGHLQVVDLVTDSVTIVPAHRSSLRALVVSPDGEMLATASDVGTLIRVWSVGSCARLAEFRRGIDPATVLSLAFSPDGSMLACTSDKATLHIFDMPNHTRRLPTQTATPSSASVRSNFSVGGLPTSSGGELLPTGSADNASKWTILGKIPLFSDLYSFASATFAVGEGTHGDSEGNIPVGVSTWPSSDNTLGTGNRPPKGVIGWLSSDSLVVVGAGKDARWEKFIFGEEEGRRSIVRQGWKRYYGA